MTTIEVMLIIIGVVFMIGSFFVTEKLSPKELQTLSELSEKEIKIITNKELAKASTEIEEQAEGVIEESIDKVERSLDKEVNEKIMAIGEYSDTVLENMNKTHSEIMFLYNMLNDKHTELTDLAGDLTELASKLNQVETKIKEEIERVEEEGVKIKVMPDKIEEAQAAEDSQKVEEEAKTEAENAKNSNERILELYNEGKSYVDIARELRLGLGEVKLVVELFRGEA